MKNLLLIAMFVFSSQVSVAQNAPKVFTEKMLDAYVTQVNAQAPILGPDSIIIMGVSRQDRTLIYRVKTGFTTTRDAAAFLNRSEATKKALCQQDAEAFFLSRGVALAWNYFDSPGNFVGTVSVSAKDC